MDDLVGLLLALAVIVAAYGLSDIWLFWLFRVALGEADEGPPEGPPVDKVDKS